MQEFLEDTKKASKIIATLDTNTKNKVLLDMATAIETYSDFIIEHNKKDVQKAYEDKLNDAFIDRLILNEKRVQDMASAIRQIASQEEPVGKVLDGWTTKDGLDIQKVSIPIGIIAIIYESRPNVTSDTAALCFKSGNVCILKGGSEAINSNRAIANILREVLRLHNLPQNAIALVPDFTREGIAKLIKEDKYIDLIIPRGGEELISYISKNSYIPVIKHDKGICHIYIDKDAAHNKIIDIAINAKCQKPSACNAMETLLIHNDIAPYIIHGLYDAFIENQVVIKACTEAIKYIEVQEASEEDFFTEYLDNILNIKIVKNVNEAIEHINKYGSGHSESILSENYTVVNKFLNSIDAACVYANASTRFTDGGSFGLGAEVGISTSKLHSRGPMGIKDLTTFKYKIYGKSNIRK